MEKSTHVSAARFVGVWRFDPTQADYQFGPPPKTGLYTISAAGEALHFTIEWTDQQDQDFRVLVTALPDGLDHPFENPAVADMICYTLIDENRLDSEAKKGGQRVAYARRVLLGSGDRMEIVQSGQTPDGRPFENKSVYLRQPE